MHKKPQQTNLICIGTVIIRLQKRNNNKHYINRNKGGLITVLLYIKNNEILFTAFWKRYDIDKTVK